MTHVQEMLETNRLLEQPNPDKQALLHASRLYSWESWLWGVDATAEITSRCTLNEMHLLFLIIARLRHFVKPDADLFIGEYLRTQSSFLYCKRVSLFTLRELLDTVQNFQHVWRDIVSTNSAENIVKVLDACFSHFGFLACKKHDESVLDCSDLVESDRFGQRFVSKACIRKFAAFFYAAYRHVHLLAASTDLDCETPVLLFDIHSHLVVASLDDFYKFAMYYDTKVAHVLQYRHEFTGMFNSISQVMYYHNPSYERRPQLPQDELVKGKQPENMLPVIQQLYPDVKLFYEDEQLPNGFKVPGSRDDFNTDSVLPKDSAGWAWIALPGRIYLATRDGFLFHSKNLIPLANLLFQNIK